MRVRHLTFSKNGGAGIAVCRLSDALNQYTKVESSIIEYNDIKLGSFMNRLFASWHWRVRDKIFYFPLNKYDHWTSLEGYSYNRLKPFLLDADIINLHWVGRFICYKDLKKISNNFPVVWTIHDQNPFSECFHYDLEKKKFLEKTKNSKFLNKLGNKKKLCLESCKKNNLFFISPSKKYQYKLKESHITSKFQVENIPNSVDSQIFIPLDKTALRDKYSIPTEAKTILFVAHDVNNLYKGVEVLLRALKVCKEKYCLIVLGDSKNLEIDYEVLNLGLVNTIQEIVEAYNLADIFINPTLEDNFPNTILEAMSCGTPVIASNVGGVPDLVKPGVTGELFKAGDYKELASRIDNWFTYDNKTQISNNCREMIIKEFSSQTQALKYENVYKKVLEEHNRLL